ncbi:hypothetical protein F2Q70_00013366 [Brassica cretica]|uniref:DUF4216 domain-containing protein n=1 Tax=Brassica cretica TaxID=69181 RepID=A0A8S9M6G7_BRACR|nr:hypothetical protein F2Q70_00013366 [Brassica cretica]
MVRRNFPTTFRRHSDKKCNRCSRRNFVGIFRRISDDIPINSKVVRIPSGPNYVVKSYPKFCTRGYAFTRKGHSKTTYDAGVSSSSGDDVYYGNIKEILEIQFPGMVGLRCVIFYCDWYDTTPDRRVKIDAFGVTSVHSRRTVVVGMHRGTLYVGSVRGTYSVGT